MNNLKTIEMYGQQVCYDFYGEKIKPEVQEFLTSDTIKNILENINRELIMVLGGDGIMLKAIRKYYKEKKDFLPINFGIKGFLLNDKEFINKNSDFVSRKYPLFNIYVQTKKEEKNDIFFNELILKDIAGKMVDLNILVGENSLDLKGDGVIVSTSAGSTGSNFSNHGPILPHNSNSLVMTYIGAYEPKRHPSSIIQNNNEIVIKNQGRINPILINTDGNEVLKTDIDQEVEVIIKKSQNFVNLLISKDYEFSWDNKVLEEQGFNS